MILQALVKYYEDLERQEKLPKQGWCQAKVSYGINLSTDGDIKNIERGIPVDQPLIM